MKKVFFVVLVMYSAMVVYLYINQRSLIFIPSSFNESVEYFFKDLYLESEDGSKIHAWWVEADNPIGVTLVYCHGNAAVLSSLVHVAEIFRDYGFDTIVFDYRGYGRSKGGKLTEDGAVQDVIAAYTSVKKEKNQPVIFWGHSLGSSICANALRVTEAKGIILEGAFTSIYDMAKVNYPFVPIFDSLLLDKFNTEAYLDDRPKLFIHAEKDSIIPIRLGRKLYESASEPKKWITVPDIDHNDFPDVADRYKDEILFWVKDVLNKH